MPMKSLSTSSARSGLNQSTVIFTRPSNTTVYAAGTVVGPNASDLFVANSITPFGTGSGYKVGDTVTLAPPSGATIISPIVGVVTSVSGGMITTIDVKDPGKCTVLPTTDDAIWTQSATWSPATMRHSSPNLILQGQFDPRVGRYPIGSDATPIRSIVQKNMVWNINASGNLSNNVYVKAGNIVYSNIDNPGQVDANWTVSNLGSGSGVGETFDVAFISPYMLNLSDSVRVNNGVGYLSGISLVTNVVGITSSFRLHLFTTPTANVAADTALYKQKYEDTVIWLGNIDLPSMSSPGDITTSDISFTTNNDVTFPIYTVNDNTGIYAILETLDGFTPVSNQSFTLTINTDMSMYYS